MVSLTDRRPSVRRRTRGVRDESSATLAPPLPLVVAGAVAGAMAALLSFIALAVIALGAWMLDPAAPWEWSQMLEAGTAAWLAGQGVPLEVLGTPLNLSPLGFGVICLVAIASATRWATSAAAVARRGEAAAVAVSFAVLYGAAAAVFAALARHLGVVPWQAGLICGAVALVLSMITLIVRVPLVTREALPDLLRDGVAAALTGALVLLLFSGVALAAMIVIHADDVARVIGALEVGAAGALLVLVLSLGYLPVALVWTTAYLLGPGFALGTSATVSPFSEAGPATLPGLPLLAAVPATPPVWAAALPLVGVVPGAGYAIGPRPAGGGRAGLPR